VHSRTGAHPVGWFRCRNARLMLGVAIAQAYVELYRENALVEIAERSANQRQDIVNITRRGSRRE